VKHACFRCAPASEGKVAPPVPEETAARPLLHRAANAGGHADILAGLKDAAQPFDQRQIEKRLPCMQMRIASLIVLGARA